MPSVPLPFVVAFLLGITLTRLLRRDRLRADSWVAVMLAAYAAQAVVLGLRWGYGVVAVQPIQAVLASALPPLSWLAFRGFVVPAPRPRLHLLWPPLVAALWLLAPVLIDQVLEVLFLAYGTALLLLALGGPDALARVPFDGEIPMLRALQVTGAMLVASAAVDLAIALDMARTHGQRAGLIAGVADMVFVALLGWAAVVAGEGAPAPTSPAAASTEPTPDGPAPDAEDLAVVQNLDALMRDRMLHHDPNLSLDRLARRVGLPARRVSAAINRVRGVNASQYVNAHRVADACRLLVESDAPITRILLDVGFQTKSNFNREFLRIKGVSPSAWRRQTPTQASPGKDDRLGAPRHSGRFG